MTTFGGSESAAGESEIDLHRLCLQSDNQRSDRPSQGGSSRYPIARSYGEAWGMSRRRGHPSVLDRESAIWSGLGRGERPPLVPPTGPRNNHSRSTWNRPPFMEDTPSSWDREPRTGDRRSPWNRPPSMSPWDREPSTGDRLYRPPFVDGSTGNESYRDSAYLSTWGSRMGQARSQPYRAGRDDSVQLPGPAPETQENSSRYVPPHARTDENQGSGWRGRGNGSRWDNVGSQHRVERPPIQQTPWRRSSAIGITRTSIFEPSENDSRPSHIVQDRPHARVEARGTESGDRGSPRPANSRPLNTNQLPGRTQASSFHNTAATAIPQDTEPQPGLQSSVIISPPSPGPGQPSLPQPPAGGRDIESFIEALLIPELNRNHQEEPVPIDPRIVELLRRLASQLEPVIVQRSNPNDNVSENPNPAVPSASENTRIGNGEGGVPLESVVNDDIPVVAVVDQGTSSRSSVPHNTDSTARTRGDLRSTPVSTNRRPIASNALRRSITTLTGFVAGGWGRARRPGDQAYASPRQVIPPDSEVLPQDLGPQRPDEEATPSQVAAPHRPDALSQGSELQRLADEATSLLELCTRTDIEQGDEERDQLIRLAIDSVLKMRGQQENMLDTQGGHGRIAHEEPASNVSDDSTKVDASCIICYDEVADTVLLPCNHLVLCVTCCDKMEIKKRGARGRQSVPCPMCRSVVEDTIKIFRG